MSWGYIAAAGATLISGYMNREASDDASDASAAGTRRALGEQARQFDIVQQQTAPYRATGQRSLGLLSAIMGTAQEQDPEQEQRYEELQSRREQLQARRDELQAQRERAKDRGEKESFFGDAAAGFVAGVPIVGAGYQHEQDEMDQELGGIDEQIGDVESELEQLEGEIGELEQQNPMLASGASLPFFSEDDIPEQYRAPETEIPEWSFDDRVDATRFDPSQIDPTQEAGYQFRREQGRRGLENMLSAQGRGMGGAALKEAMRFNQGFASNEYQKAFGRALQTNQMRYGREVDRYGRSLSRALTDRSMAVEDYQREYGQQQNAVAQLFQLAGFGPAATSTSAQAGQGMASNVASILQNNATTQGNIAMAEGQGYNQALQSGIGNAMTWMLANQDGETANSGMFTPYNRSSAVA